jgi:hypothetical protein
MFEPLLGLLTRLMWNVGPCPTQIFALRLTRQMVAPEVTGLCSNPLGMAADVK